MSTAAIKVLERTLSAEKSELLHILQNVQHYSSLANEASLNMSKQLEKIHVVQTALEKLKE